MATKKYTTDAVIPPGLYLEEVLEEFGMTQVELARRMGRPAQTINEIVNGNKSLTAETAIQLEQVLGVPAYMWNDLEAESQLAKARRKEEAGLSEDLNLLSQFNFYSTLAAWGVVSPATSNTEKIAELRRFFQVSSLRNVQPIWQPAFRTWSSGTISLYALAAWLRVGEIRAGKRDNCTFSGETLKGLLPEIRTLTLTPLPNALLRLENILASSGVSFVALKPLPKTRACGAAFWLRRCNPVVMVSDLGNSEDLFWFNLFHELGHILLHGPVQTFVSLEKAAPWDNERLEEEADAFSRNTLIPEHVWNAWAWRGTYPTNEAISSFATSIKVDAGIVAGRLCKEGHMPWKRIARFRRSFELPEAA